MLHKELFDASEALMQGHEKHELLLDDYVYCVKMDNTVEGTCPVNGTSVKRIKACGDDLCVIEIIGKRK